MKKLNLIRRLFLAGLLMLSNGMFAQNEANNWVFGNGGGMSFAPIMPYPTSTFSTSINQAEGVATMSDVSGNLLFYTNGQTIWNGSHTSVVTGLLGHQSSTQSAIIVPDPADTDEYYIFTVDRFAAGNGLQYVKYRTDTEALVGTSTLLQTPVSEKVTAVNKEDDSGYWIVAHGWNNSDFYIYEIDCGGLSLHATQSVGAPHGFHINNTLGYMKFNSDGSRLAIANTYGNHPGPGAPSVAQSFGFVQVLNFDNIAGSLSGSGIVNIGTNGANTADDGATLFTPYGLEFSNSSDFLYIGEVGRTSSATAGSVFQYEFATGNLIEIGSANGTTYDVGALQMGRDGDIYVAIDGQSFLGKINNPETVIATGGVNFGLAANRRVLATGTVSRLGLPNFVQSIFEETAIDISGTECSPTFSYSGSGDIASYHWDFGVLPAVTSTLANPSYTYANPGSYTVTLTLTTTAGCEVIYTIDVTAEDCCPILGGATDVIYHSINETISSDTYWSGTHYVEDGVIITVADAISLDITNVDVIFGECAGINFIGGSTARINNSVLRPCDMTKTWRGLYFYPNTIGEKPTVTINETTFKNAQTGVYFNGTTATFERALDMKFTNNLFLNNQMGIYLRNTVFNENITGNTFTVEDVNLFNDTNCAGLTLTTSRFGVYFWNVRSVGKVSQNDFICSRSHISLNLNGISTGRSSAIISDNNFTNNSSAISLRFGSNSKIEHNTVNISADHYLNTNQISIFQTRNVQINANEISNGNDFNPDISTGTQSAISILSRSSDISIKQNEVSGFETGIHINQSTRVTVSENDIQNSWRYGVYLSSQSIGNSALISCNTINMYNRPNADVTGIGYFQNNATNYRHKIYSNCIFETNQAIHLENTSNATNVMPDIKNNFMYNYTRAGVENIGMTGNIGTSGVSHTNAGRNSFIANNSPNHDGTTTGDIISSTTINQNGNYGVGIFTATVLGNANAQSFHSTSSCGGQNRWGNNFANEIEEAEFCDAVGTSLGALLKRVEGKVVVKTEAYEEIDELREAVYVLSQIAENNSEKLIETLDLLKANSPIYTSDYSVLDYLFALYTNDYETALTLAESLDENVVSNAEKTILLNATNNVSWLDLTEEQQYEILPENQSTLAPTHLNNEKILNADELTLRLYPNPTEGNLTVELNIPSENPIVKIFDVNGRLLETQYPSAKNMLLQLNVNHLAKGLYFLTVEGSGVSTQGKFSKN